MKTMKFAAAAVAVAFAAGSFAAEQIKDPYHPMVNGSPVTLMKSNLITQALGGRLVDLDVWVGEFVKNDDNIYGVKKNSAGDTIFSTAAGFKLQAEDKNVWGLRMEGQLQHNNYKRHSEYNGEEGYFNAAGNIDFSPAFSGRVKLGYNNKAENLRAARDIYKNEQYNAGLGATFRLSPYSAIDVDYGFLAQRRDLSSLKKYDYDENSVTVRGAHQLTDKTTVYVLAGGAVAEPKKDKFANKTTSGTIGVGAAWNYHDDARLYAEVGYKFMHFDDSSLYVDDDDSVSRPTLRVGGDMMLNSDWKLGAAISYGPQVSATTTDATHSNYIDQTTISAFAQYSPGAGRFTATLTPFYTKVSPSKSVDADYNEYGVALGVTYSFVDWLNVSAGYRFSVKDYDDMPKYNRNIVTIGVAGTF